MPARNERVCLLPDDASQAARVVKFPLWWDRREFFATFGDRGVDTGNPFYVDYGIPLSPSEAMALDERGRQQFAGDERSRLPLIVEEMRVLADALPRSRWVIVESYEWESGLE